MTRENTYISSAFSLGALKDKISSSPGPSSFEAAITSPFNESGRAFTAFAPAPRAFCPKAMAVIPFEQASYCPP